MKKSIRCRLQLCNSWWMDAAVFTKALRCKDCNRFLLEYQGRLLSEERRFWDGICKEAKEIRSKKNLNEEL